MPELGLFPLQLVLLPSERVPLHIFEPRYKELIGECLESGGEFGLLLEDEEGRREIGTRAAVTEVLQVFDDGRLNVVVEGRERFRLLGLTDGRSYLTATVEPHTDEPEPPAGEVVTRVLEIYRRLVAVAEVEVEEPDLSSRTLSYELAGRVEFGHDLKQELLELRSEQQRLERLIGILEHAVETITLEREVRDRASRNGKVSPRG